MPHQCAACGQAFADGSKEMLSGCPECGGNKFQFIPQSQVSTAGADTAHTTDERGSTSTETVASGDTAAAGSPDADSPGRSRESSDTSSASRSTAETGSASEPKGNGNGNGNAGESANASPTRNSASNPNESADAMPPTFQEDSAQASARSEVVDSNELPSRSSKSQRDPADFDEQDTSAPRDEPDLADLRDELNTQFESIKIVNPGEYELNLMELYDRQEYIISLQENGRYVIEMPGGWGADDE